MGSRGDQPRILVSWFCDALTGLARFGASVPRASRQMRSHLSLCPGLKRCHAFSVNGNDTQAAFNPNGQRRTGRIRPRRSATQTADRIHLRTRICGLVVSERRTGCERPQPVAPRPQRASFCHETERLCVRAPGRTARALDRTSLHARERQSRHFEAILSIN